MKKLIASCVVAMCFSIGTQCLAQLPPNFDSALSELGGLGTGVNNNIGDPEKYVPNYNTDQTGNGDLYGDGDVTPIEPGKGKTADCSTKELDSNLYKRQECEGINFIGKNRTIRPNMSVTNNDPIISGNRKITSDPRENLEKNKWILPAVNPDGSFGGVPSSACPTTTVVTQPIYEERHCTFFKGAENFLCKAPLKVMVDPQFNYKCLDTLGVNSNEKCSKTLVVECTGGVFANSCTGAGVVASDFNADMKVSFDSMGSGFFRLGFGTLADNYWGGPKFVGKTYERTLTINVEAKERLDAFLLEQVVADDYVLVKVNGNVVYGTPPIVDRIEAVSRPNGRIYYKTSGDDSSRFIEYADRAPPFGENIRPNFDIRPYLVNGKNTIYTKTLVGGGGEVYLGFITRVACPVACTERWQNQCTTLEERAK